MRHGVLDRRVLFGLLLCFSFGWPPGARGQEQAVFVPEEVGLSSDRLTRIHAMLQTHIDRGELAGAVTMIARRGKVVHFEAHGMANLEARRPMRRDDLFRIASMTKMVTTVAAMMLYEDGHFTLQDPVSTFIPAFRSMQVALPDEGNQASPGAFTTVPAQNQITIRDLLRHTAGFTYAGGAHVVDPLYREAGLRSWDKSLPAFVEQLAAIPLAYQPGAGWEYSLATDVLGYLVEVVSGQPLDQFFEERIFEPLQMKDTGFVVPASALDRLVNVYEYDAGALSLLESADDTPLRYRPPAFSGGGGWASLGSDGGLVSTSEDYMRLLQMLLQGGILDGKRLLSRKTVELMMMDHLDGLPTWLGPGVGFGLGLAVLQEVGAYGELGSPGQVWWAGSDNTYFWIDPAEAMIGLFMTQIRPFGHLNLMGRFQQLAMQAIAD
jgi:CubicO group peptidase (beta-lactamase class C family)